MNEPTGKTSTQIRLGRIAPDNAQMMPALPQFAHITRYWDNEHNCFSARLLPGEYYVTRHAEVVSTVLGSCVSACIRDTRLNIGGMNHFMLPLDGSQRRERLGRRGERRHALRQRGHGTADQRHPEARRPARGPRDQAGRRRARARGDAHRHRRAQHRVRAPVRARGRLQGRQRGSRRRVRAPRGLFSADRPHARAQAHHGSRRDAGGARAPVPASSSDQPVEGDIELF